MVSLTQNTRDKHPPMRIPSHSGNSEQMLPLVSVARDLSGLRLIFVYDSDGHSILLLELSRWTLSRTDVPLV